MPIHNPNNQRPGADLLERSDVGRHLFRVQPPQLPRDGQDLHRRECVEDVGVVADIAAETAGAGDGMDGVSMVAGTCKYGRL